MHTVNLRIPPCLCGEGRHYTVTYLPVSSTRAATCSCRPITLTGSSFTSRRTMAIWVRSMSPSATAAITFLAAASSFGHCTGDIDLGHRVTSALFASPLASMNLRARSKQESMAKVSITMSAIAPMISC